MITCSWKLSAQHSTYSTTCQLNNQNKLSISTCNFSIQCLALYISLIISFYIPMLKRYWTRIRRDESWIIAVRLKFIVANSWPRCEDSVKCPPKCIICQALTQGLFPVSSPIVFTQNGGPSEPGAGRALPHKRLMGMCRWMESHFHDRIDYNGVPFSIALLEWVDMFSDFWGEKVVHIYG